jgi:DNA-binding YbaB/EbfC family protein
MVPPSWAFVAAVLFVFVLVVSSLGSVFLGLPRNEDYAMLLAATSPTEREKRHSMQNYAKMQKQLEQMQAKMLKMQEELQNSTFEGTSGGGAVTVTMTGKFDVTAVKLAPEVVDPQDVSMLEDLVLTACRDAFEKVTAAQGQMMARLTGGLSLPPGFSL